MKFRILTVDDSQSILKSNKRLLEMSGVLDVTILRDPKQEQLSLWNDYDVFDLVITDYQMTYVTGEGFVRMLRTFAGYKGPILTLTGSSKLTLPSIIKEETRVLSKGSVAGEALVEVVMRELLSTGAHLKMFRDFSQSFLRVSTRARYPHHRDLVEAENRYYEMMKKFQPART